VSSPTGGPFDEVGYGVITLPPSVTTRRPSDANDHASAPVRLAHRGPLVPAYHWLELSELPMIRSFDPLLQEVLLRKTDEPASKLKLRSSLPMLMLFEISLEPGLRL
jgi:hypothetical protein